MHLDPAHFLLVMFCASHGFFAESLKKMQATMLDITALFVITLPIAVPFSLGCGQWHPCNLQRLAGMFENRGLPDEAALKRYCRPALDYLKCTKDYDKSCSGSDYTWISESTYDDISELASLLCEESSELRKNYVENVGCYNEAFESYDLCLENMTFLEMSFRRTLYSESDGREPTSIAVTCLLMPSLRNCTLREMEEQCGKDESEPLRAISNLILAAMTEIQCPIDEMKMWEDSLNKFLEESDVQK